MSRFWLPAESELTECLKDVKLADDSVTICAKLKERGGKEKPLITPICHSSTYTVESVQQYLDILKDGGYIYARCGNPTCEAAEAAVNAIEGGAGSLVFSSGMAAITTALQCFLQPGDHLICCNPVYSGVHMYVTKVLSKMNIEVTFVESGSSVDKYREAMKPNTKVMYGETPCNPTCSILDLEEFGRLGKGVAGVVTMVDATYGSPYLQRPLKHGIDISIHSGTKYLGGHSDLLAGVITCHQLEHWKELLIYRTTLGNTLSPFDATLLCRGIKTLALRMDRHSYNAQRCAEFLETHPKIRAVHYPGLSSHPGHEVARKQMRSFGGVMAFEMSTLEEAQTVVQNVRLIQFAVSLGGVESLIQHPASMTHGPMVMDDKERTEAGLKDGLIRLSVGLENADDLIADLERALSKV